MRHQIPRCAIVQVDGVKYPDNFSNRDWHCCECGWPTAPCAEMYPRWRLGETSATSPRCGDDALPYLMAMQTNGHSPRARVKRKALPP